MKISMIGAALIGTLFLTACGTSNKSSDAPAPASAEASNSTGAEHCLKTDCFLEVSEGGKSKFYAKDAAYKTFINNSQLAENGITLTSISDDKYASLVAENHAPRVVYGGEAIEVHSDEDANRRLPKAGAFGKLKGFFSKIGGPLGTLANILYAFSFVQDLFSSDSNAKIKSGKAVTVPVKFVVNGETVRETLDIPARK